MQETEASLELTRLAAKEKQLAKFCPIIKQRCRESCICFGQGGVIKDCHYKAGYRLVMPECTHVLISGVLYTEGA